MVTTKPEDILAAESVSMEINADDPNFLNFISTRMHDDMELISIKLDVCK